MKKLSFSLIIIAITLSILVACGSEETSTSNMKDQGNVAVDVQGVSDDKIKIGYIAAQTGPAASYDVIRKGVDSYFNYTNEQGGIDGRELELVAYDNQMLPAETVQLAARAVEDDKVFALLGTFCTPCNSAIKDYIIDKGIPMVLTNSGASEFVNPPIENYMGSINLNYRVEAKILLDYAINELDAKNIAVVYQNDDFGMEGLEAVREAIKNYPDANMVTEVPFVAGETEFTTQAVKLGEVNPDAILNFALINQAASLKKTMYELGINEPNYLVSYTGGMDSTVIELAGEDVWEGTYSTTIFPIIDGSSNDEQVNLFVERFTEDYPNDLITANTQAGWAMAQVLVEAIERTGDDLTWGNFLNSFYTFDDWKGSMYTGVTFSEENHYGLTTLSMTKAIDGELQVISEPISFDPLTGEVLYSE